MEMFKFLLAVLTFSVSRDPVVQSGSCPPPYEECRCYSKTIRCNFLDWPTLPQINNGTQIGPVEVFDVSHNEIYVILTDSIPTGVRSLKLRGNPISYIEPGAFDSCQSTLNFIRMKHVKFTKVPDAFLGLQNLTLFSLQDAELEDWNPPVFYNFAATLETLDLQYSTLKSWPSWFKNLTKLSTVVLTSEFIHTIPDEAFVGSADTLESLSINFSNLTHVPKALGFLRNLKRIDLDYCNFQDLSGIPRTEWLSLRDAGIRDDTGVSGGLKDTTDSLSDLYLDGNKLTTIPDFSKLSTLEFVDLSSNEISDATKGSFPNSVHSIRMKYSRLPRIPKAVANKPNLGYMYLSYNSITQISAGDIPKSMVILDLDHNEISEITPDSFPVDSQMTRLNLKVNPLHTISPTAFVNLKRLEYLNLTATSLTGIPLALASLDSLHVVDLVYINNPSCSCPVPEELLRWFAERRDQVAVYGACSGVEMRSYLKGATCPTQAVTVTHAPPSDTNSPLSDTTMEDDNRQFWASHCLQCRLFVCLFVHHPTY